MPLISAIHPLFGDRQLQRSAASDLDHSYPPLAGSDKKSRVRSTVLVCPPRRERKLRSDQRWSRLGIPSSPSWGSISVCRLSGSILLVYSSTRETTSKGCGRLSCQQRYFPCAGSDNSATRKTSLQLFLSPTRGVTSACCLLHRCV